MAFNWAGWGAADKSTPNDRVKPEQQNPLVVYIDQYYDRGYKALGENARQKRFGALHKAGAFRGELALQGLGSDGIQTGEPKSWTNYLEVQQGGFISNLVGKVGGFMGKLAKPLVSVATSIIPGGGVIGKVADAVLPGGGGTSGPTWNPPVTTSPLSPTAADPAQPTSLSGTGSASAPSFRTVALLGGGALVLVVVLLLVRR
jgi:hypothetical protein